MSLGRSFIPLCNGNIIPWRTVLIRIFACISLISFGIPSLFFHHIIVIVTTFITTKVIFRLWFFCLEIFLTR